MWCLYRFSDGLYWLNRYVFAYRKEVVTNNLVNAFPRQGAEGIGRIRNGFYRHFCDVLVEIIKNFSISRSELMERVAFEDKGVFEAFYQKG